MSIGNEIKETYKSIPEPVKSFLKRTLLVFIMWKLVYHIFLYNDRVIDEPLTHLTSYSTSKVLSRIYPVNQFSVYTDCKPFSAKDSTVSCIDIIKMDYRKAVGISDYCNGLELYILYIGFLFCIPASTGRAFLFGIIGISIIYVSNIIRCVAIAMMNIHQNRLTDIAHHYIFKMIMYSMIFLLWLFYAKRNSNKES